MIGVNLDLCAACGAHQLPGRHACARCGKTVLSVVSHEGRGRVVAATRLDRPPADAPIAEAPLHILMVRLEGTDGVRVMSVSDRAAAVGERVMVRGKASGAPYQVVGYEDAGPSTVPESAT